MSAYNHLLDIYLSGHLAGHLHKNKHGGLEMTYTDSWKTHPQRYPLSLSLPIEGKRPSKSVANVIEGYLPENATRSIWERQFHINSADPVDVLREVGTDVAGAAQSLPPGKQPTTSRRRTPLSNKEIAHMIAGVRDSHANIPPDRVLRLSLAGQQEKIALGRDEQGWYLPELAEPSTHILKPAGKYVQDIDRLEVAALRTAQRLGIPVAVPELRTISGQDVFISKRYDRTLDAKKNIVRVHQEDFLQALGWSPTRKYQRKDNGPSLVDMATLIQRNSSNSEDDIDSFIRLTALNVAIGNADAHGKNHAFIIEPGGRVSLAPAYDVIPVSAFPEYDQQLSQSVGRNYNYRTVSAKDWEHFAAKSGIDSDHVLGLVSQVWEHTPEFIVEAMEEMGVSADKRHLVSEVAEAAEIRAKSIMGSNNVAASSVSGVGTCRACGRQLTNPKSIAKGLGSACAARSQH